MQKSFRSWRRWCGCEIGMMCSSLRNASTFKTSQKTKKLDCSHGQSNFFYTTVRCVTVWRSGCCKTDGQEAGRLPGAYAHCPSRGWFLSFCAGEPPCCRFRRNTFPHPTPAGYRPHGPAQDLLFGRDCPQWPLWCASLPYCNLR